MSRYTYVFYYYYESLDVCLSLFLSFLLPPPLPPSLPHPSLPTLDAPSFLLISTADAIYYLPVAPSTAIDAIPPEPLPLSIGPLYNVSAITYDPNSERVLWADSVSGRVGVASILGSPCSTIATLSDLSPVSLAYDWKGNTVFLTEWNRFGIELVSGSGVKVLLRDLMAYQDLAMNSDTQ